MPDLCNRQTRKGIPAARDNAGKEWQEASTQSVQTEDAKGDVRSFGSQDILSNGNGMRYLQKKEEGGGRNSGNISEHLSEVTCCHIYRHENVET